MEKYACTPLTMGANPEDRGPVTLAMLPTMIWWDFTPGAPPPLLIPCLAFPQAAIPNVSATTAAPTVANLPRRLRDIGPPLPCHLHRKGQALRLRQRPRIDAMPDVCVSSCFCHCSLGVRRTATARRAGEATRVTGPRPPQEEFDHGCTVGRGRPQRRAGHG